MKINYHQRYLETIKTLDHRPTLLLHLCCGPCSANVIKDLDEYFDITLFYSNSNIYPPTEYQRRYQELVEFIKVYRPAIKIIEKPYEPIQFLDHLSLYGNIPEGGKRCHLCYQLRMKDAYDYASKNNYEYYTTVLSVSPHKNSQWINEIGISLEQGNTKFLQSDFKKDSGYLKSTQIANEYHLYRQTYCGCVYSYQQSLNRKKDNTK